MRKQIEALIGHLVVLGLFVFGAGLCGYIIYQDQQRQQGALALVIGAGLLYAGWCWITKERDDGQDVTDDGQDDERAER